MKRGLCSRRRIADPQYPPPRNVIIDGDLAELYGVADQGFESGSSSETQDREVIDRLAGLQVFQLWTRARN